MMEERAAPPGREEAAEDAGRWLPSEASIVALVRVRGGGAWAAGVAVGLADIVGRRRGRTFLVNTVPGMNELDGLLEASARPGLTRALAGDVPVARVARAAPQQSFAYLPAGEPALPLARLREIPAFRAFLRRVAERGGTVLLYVADEDLHPDEGPPGTDGLPLNGCIAIGDVEDLPLVTGAPLLARVERPGRETAAGEEAEASAGAEDGADRALLAAAESDAREDERAAARRRRRLRAASVAGLVVVVAALALFVRGREGEPGAASGSGADSAAVAEAPATTVAAETETPETETPEAGPPVFRGPDLPYSVLVASYARREDAARAVSGLDVEDLLILAPTPIRGRVYWRVLAGAREDRREGEALMRRLVDEGVKDVAREWDVRPVRLAFLLGTFGASDDASRRRDALEEEGVPAYVVAGESVETPAFRVYAGAYESAEAAVALDSLLREAELPTDLVTRTGRPQ